MILVVDQPKTYRVYKTSSDAEGQQKRTHLGAIPKSTMEVPPEITSAFTVEEKADFAAQYALLKAGAKLKLQGALAAFPETAREVVEYALSSGTHAERQIVAATIFEAVRVIRKRERAEA